MVGRYPVVAICGNEEFQEDILQAMKSLTQLGQITITTGLVPSGSDVSDIDHQKIDFCDRVFVVNRNNSVGPRVQAIIDYAKKNQKSVDYMYPYQV